MAITAAVLYSGIITPSGVNCVTTSITPGANKLLLALFGGRTAVDPAPDSVIDVSGNGLTWDRMAKRQSGARFVECHRTMGASPSAGAVTFALNSSSYVGNQVAAVIEFSGVVTGGTNGSNAVGGTIDDSAASFTTSIAVNIGTAPGASDAAFGGMAVEDDATSVAQDANWDNLARPGSAGNSECILSVDWDLGQDGTATWTWGGNQEAAAVAFWILAAAAAGGILRQMMQHNT